MKRARGICAAVVLLLLATSAAHAQPQWKAHGLLDLGLVSSIDGRELNRLTIGDSNFDPYRVRLFLDARLSPTLELHLQTLLHEGMWGLRADGAYALWTPWAGRDVSLEAGKIPWPIGTYAPRAYSDRNWLVGTPLLYQYRTALPWATSTKKESGRCRRGGGYDGGYFRSRIDPPQVAPQRLISKLPTNNNIHRPADISINSATLRQAFFCGKS